MNKLKLLLSCVLVGALVALTYLSFERAVHHSTNYIWNTVLDTQNNRYMVVPLCIILSILFFGLQHRLDPKSEGREEHSLGGTPIKPTLKNLGIILLLGYFSLTAGASLGPEAVLVPACTVIGAYCGVKLFKKNAGAAKLLVAAAVMALMTAFFHSFVVGILSLLLVTKQAKIKVSPVLVLVAIISSASSFFVLDFLASTNHYLNLPDLTWQTALVDILAGVGLVIVGYLSTFALKYTHQAFIIFRSKTKLISWWQIALVAGAGLSLFYLLGGPLVEFTGNESIAPLVSQSSSLGLAGLLGILVTKLLAIGWSRALGYRGGLIFPMIFIASTLALISQTFLKDVNFAIGLVAAMAGILAAEKKAKILL